MNCGGQGIGKMRRDETVWAPPRGSTCKVSAGNGKACVRAVGAVDGASAGVGDVTG